MITNYQEKRLIEQLNEMAKSLATWKDRPLGETLGGLIYLVWEARQTLNLPDVKGLDPV